MVAVRDFARDFPQSRHLGLSHSQDSEGDLVVVAEDCGEMEVCDNEFDEHF